MVVILSLKFDTHFQLTLVSPELTLGLKFDPSWIHYPTCPTSWFLETKFRVYQGRENSIITFALKWVEVSSSKCKCMLSGLKFLSWKTILFVCLFGLELNRKFIWRNFFFSIIARTNFREETYFNISWELNFERLQYFFIWY